MIDIPSMTEQQYADRFRLGKVETPERIAAVREAMDAHQAFRELPTLANEIRANDLRRRFFKAR